jgi:hypothetical protein
LSAITAITYRSSSVIGNEAIVQLDETGRKAMRCRLTDAALQLNMLRRKSSQKVGVFRED